MIKAVRELYEQFCKETCGEKTGYLPWDQVPAHVQGAWLNVWKRACEMNDKFLEEEERGTKS